MSILFRRQVTRGLGDSMGELVPRRTGQSAGAVMVTADTALRESAVWACQRLRANLLSTTPLDVYRMVGDVQVEAPRPPLLTNPGGDQVDLLEWLYSTQFDLDRFGNTYGLITALDGQGFPKVIELQQADKVRVYAKGSTITGYGIAGKRYDPTQVWHEKQYTVAGLPVGLSPIAYAAYSIGAYLSAQQFALDWFATGAFPSGTLKNTTQKELSQKTIGLAKAKFKEAVSHRDIFVTGMDWEFNMAPQTGAASAFLDEMKFGIGDICRFMDVPGDMIDAESATGSITYANIGQRNTQLLVTSMGPVFVRRETALTRAMPAPRFAKFNTDAMLRMDPQTRAEVILRRVAGRTLAPSEARALDNLPPFTEEQWAEIERLGLPPLMPGNIKEGAPKD